MVVSADFDEFSKLLHSEIYIKKEELRVFGGENISDLKENCSMSLHRNSCSNPALLPLETITWNTRICFRWKCLIGNFLRTFRKPKEF